MSNSIDELQFESDMYEWDNVLDAEDIPLVCPNHAIELLGQRVDDGRWEWGCNACGVRYRLKLGSV